jgi:hypothetical protein
MKLTTMKLHLVIVTVLGLLCRSLTAAELPKETQNSYDLLKKASIFAIGPVGFAGTTSPTEKALREIVKQKDAKLIFAKLLDEASPEGQMYALAGVKAVDAAEFKSRLKSYTTKSGHVCTEKGCMVSTKSISEVAKLIAAGNYDLASVVSERSIHLIR